MHTDLTKTVSQTNRVFFPPVEPVDGGIERQEGAESVSSLKFVPLPPI